MIRTLRKRHRIAFPLIFLVVAPLFVLGILWRPADAVVGERLPRPFEVPGFEVPGKATSDVSVVWSETSLRVSKHGAPGEEEIWISADEPLGVPDPLLYWIPEQTEVDDGLPPSARLIGSVGNAFSGLVRLRLPAAARAPGALAVYSLGHDRVLSTMAWHGFPGPEDASQDLPNDETAAGVE